MLRYARLLALATIMIGGGIGLAAVAAAPNSAPAAQTTATPPPESIDYGAATLVSGSIVSFMLDPGTITTDADGVSHARGGLVSYILVSNDSRIAGLVTGTWQADGWGPDQGSSAFVQWGTETLTSRDGSWVADYSGIYTDVTGDVISWWYQGRGAYAGLTFFMWMTDPDLWTCSGFIYPGTPPGSKMSNGASS